MPDAAPAPKLSEHICVFLDVLGSALLATDNKAASNLRRLHGAIELAHRVAMRKRRDAEYNVVTFTDNLVMGWPIEADPAEKLAETLREAAVYQYSLTRFGFFVRGGLAVGGLYMHSDFVFGPALIEAYEHERSVALQPRVVLSREAAATARHALGRRRPPARLRRLLAVSGDDRVFVNYLDATGADGRAELLRHKHRVEQELRTQARSPRIWEKFRWLADYHNYFCRSNFPRQSDLLIESSSISTRFRPFR
ncbi:MAG: hypothetical protein EPO22_06015 [Dehalococcoidia bacterium]|nr:MAG: hypothetical protein EPO22_06015 [Dehalococcoidia bacterium]